MTQTDLKHGPQEDTPTLENANLPAGDRLRRIASDIRSLVTEPFRSAPSFIRSLFQGSVQPEPTTVPEHTSPTLLDYRADTALAIRHAEYRDAPLARAALRESIERAIASRDAKSFARACRDAYEGRSARTRAVMRSFSDPSAPPPATGESLLEPFEERVFENLPRLVTFRPDGMVEVRCAVDAEGLVASRLKANLEGCAWQFLGRLQGNPFDDTFQYLPDNVLLKTEAPAKPPTFE